MKILVTGAAGFIGAHCVLRLLRDGHQVFGLDNFNNYYDPQLKHDRVQWVQEQVGHFQLSTVDLADAPAIETLFAQEQPEVVIHLAAQAGVRYSLDNPRAYLDSNLNGFLNILESCRRHPVKHLIYASSSSVYGANQHTPYSVQDGVNHPLSLYAATKKANELMAHSYSHLFGIPCTGLRFFTVYGPWGRPDMAIFLFTKAILDGAPIKLFNHGNMRRDFTYVDDVASVIGRLIGHVPRGDDDAAPARIYNVGNHAPEDLLHVVTVLEKELGQEAVKTMLPMQPGDVPETFADVDDLMRDVGFKPDTSIEDGIKHFVAWYRSHYGV